MRRFQHLVRLTTSDLWLCSARLELCEVVTKSKGFHISSVCVPHCRLCTDSLFVPRRSDLTVRPGETLALRGEGFMNSGVSARCSPARESRRRRLSNNFRPCALGLLLTLAGAAGFVTLPRSGLHQVSHPGAPALGAHVHSLSRVRTRKDPPSSVFQRLRERVHEYSAGDRNARVHASSAGQVIRTAAGLAIADMENAQDASKIIDGKATAAEILSELKARVAKHVESADGVAPGLAVVLVGERRDSATYVRMKKKACEEIGVRSFGFDFPEDATQHTLLACVAELNTRPDVHGILVQLPLPKHIDEQDLLQAITPAKDVDGLHPDNVAALCTGRTREGEPMSWAFTDLDFHVPCTPQGCIELLDRHGVEIAGKRAVVLGRSNIVGIPVSMLLMHRDATVTMTHSKTVDVASVVKEADIVVCAAGRAEMVQADWIKPGAAVIDVGINSVDDASTKKGYRLVGDVDFQAAKEVAAKITPVPGGVGPMTIAMLMRNTVNSAIRAHARHTDGQLPPAPPANEMEQTT